MSSDKAVRGEQLFALRQLQLKPVVCDGATVSAAALKSVLRAVDDHGDECWASTTTIARETCLSEKTVRRAIRALIGLGLLIAEARKGQTASLKINWITARTPVTVTAPVIEATPVILTLTPVTVSTDPGNPDPNPGNSYRRSEKKRKGSEKKRNTRRAFVAPSLSEVEVFWKSKSLDGSPQEFFNHYQANGWTQGQRATPMRSWHHAAHNWSLRQPQFTRSSYGKPRSANVGPGVKHQTTNGGTYDVNKF